MPRTSRRPAGFADRRRRACRGWWRTTSRDRRARACRRIPVTRDSPGKDNQGNTVQSLHDIRKLTLWGNLTGGGAGVEYYFGYVLPDNDLTLENFRSRDKSWDYARIALGFFRDEKIPFWDMTNADLLVGNSTNDNSVFCFAKAGEVYLVYLPNGGSAALDLAGVTGQFNVSWFDPRSGGALKRGSVASVKAGGKQRSGCLPAVRKRTGWLSSAAEPRWAEHADCAASGSAQGISPRFNTRRGPAFLKSRSWRSTTAPRSAPAALMAQYGIPRFYGDWKEMLDRERPDFVDIITPPETHEEMCAFAAARGIHIICQKPLAPTYEASQRIVVDSAAADVRFMVHENFRWQPWYREIKERPGAWRHRRLHAHPLPDAHGRRLGRGRISRAPAVLPRIPATADLRDRRPFHRHVPVPARRGDSVFAETKRLNPAIRGEDAGQLLLKFRNGSTAIWDANRYNEVEAESPRFTFGELRIDGTARSPDDGHGARRSG